MEESDHKGANGHADGDEVHAADRHDRRAYVGFWPQASWTAPSRSAVQTRLPILYVEHETSHAVLKFAVCAVC